MNGLPPLSHLLRVSALPTAVGIACAAASWWAAGTNLGLFLGAVGLVTLAAAALVLSWRQPSDGLLVAGSLLDGAGAVWLVVWLSGAITLRQWLGSYVLLAGYLTALSGMAVLLRELRLKAWWAAGWTTLTGCAWLTWPMWLGPRLTGDVGQRAVGWLTEVHPLLALNQLLDMGNWTEQAIAYRLTRLNQDVPYALPESILPCVVFHAGLGTAMMVLVYVRRRPQGETA